MSGSYKGRLKELKALYYLNSRLKAYLQDKRIQMEQTRYSRLARARGIAYSEEVVWNTLSARLAQRRGGPKAKGELHLAFIAAPANWERQIPPQMEKFGPVTLYYWKERGFDDRSPKWLTLRDTMEADIQSFLLAIHNQFPIDAVFSYLSGRQVSGRLFRELAKQGILTCNICYDDVLYFHGRHYGDRWTGPVDFVREVDLNLTSSRRALVKYSVEGGLAVYWPEAANPDLMKPVEQDFRYDVSFFGTKYGYRPLLIDYLRKHGVNVAAFGREGEWEHVAPSEDIPRICSQSRINLGFGGIGHSARAFHLKCRDFEIPMCGGLYLTSYNPELRDCYELDKEIVCYNSKSDCVMKIRYLLDHPDDAEAIRRAGHARAQRDHTWERRLEYVLTMARVLKGV